MRTLIIVFILLTGQLAFTQKNFEGKIVYTSTPFMDSKPDTQIVYFGKQKLRIDNRIYDFNTGLVYTVEADDSNYLQQPITDFIISAKKRKLGFTGSRKNISGFTCFAYGENRHDDDKIGSSLMRLYWYCDSLKYFIPSIFKNCVEILDIIDDDRVLVERSVISKIDSTIINTLSATIIPEPLPISVFRLPTGNFMEIRDTPPKRKIKKKGNDNRIKIGGTKR